MFRHTIVALLALLWASASLANDVPDVFALVHAKNGVWVTITPLGCDKQARTDGKGGSASCAGMNTRLRVVLDSFQRSGYVAKTDKSLPDNMLAYQVLIEGKDETMYIVQSRFSKRKVEVKEILADRDLANIAYKLDEASLVILPGILARLAEFGPPAK